MDLWLNLSHFPQFELSPFCSTSTEAYRHWVSCERNLLLLQFYPYIFETLVVFLSKPEDVHAIWMYTGFCLGLRCACNLDGQMFLSRSEDVHAIWM